MDEDRSILLYQVIIGAVAIALIATIGLSFYFRSKANVKEQEIAARVAGANKQVLEEAEDQCEVEKREIVDNPWTEIRADQVFGAFAFKVPRSWSKYQFTEVKDANSYRFYAHPEVILYDVENNELHTPLYVLINKNFFDNELQKTRNLVKKNKGTENKITVSGFDSYIFSYVDKELDRKVGTVLVPYRDKTMMINSDDYDKYSDYYNQFIASFRLTP